MTPPTTPVHEAIHQAIERGSALSRAEVRALREKSELAIRLFKISIFVLLGIFVIALWLGLGLLDPVKKVELPFAIPTGVLLGISLASLALIFIVPVRKIRAHFRYLELLEPTEPGPKKSRANDAGKAYIEQARKDGRTFTRAEIEVLEASRDTTLEN
ncbi:MAG: hypothetical protein C0624_09105 [Desulfuromonas sp.]|nr:MAG: hypothetical protein C0624_09105 [Desulfuromonas sp.]